MTGPPPGRHHISVICTGVVQGLSMYESRDSDLLILKVGKFLM